MGSTTGTVNGLIVTSSSVMSLGTDPGTENGHAESEVSRSIDRSPGSLFQLSRIESQLYSLGGHL